MPWPEWLTAPTVAINNALFINVHSPKKVACDIDVAPSPADAS